MAKRKRRAATIDARQDVAKWGNKHRYDQPFQKYLEPRQNKELGTMKNNTKYMKLTEFFAKRNADLRDAGRHELADRAEVQLAYAIGVADPVSVHVNTFGTNHIDEGRIEQIVRELFPLKPRGIIEHLDLLKPIYLNI